MSETRTTADIDQEKVLEAHIVASLTAHSGDSSRLKEYRSALITAAFRGQIDVQTYAKTGTRVHRLGAIQEEMRV